MSVVYQITNIINGKFYIGSTCNFDGRIYQHFCSLKRNNHSNVHLQNSYNKYGKSNFTCQILAHCPVEYQFKLEQWFLDNLSPEFNLSKFAVFTQQLPNSNNTINNKRLGQIRRCSNPIERLKRSIATKLRWKLDKSYADKLRNLNKLENHPQSTITNDVARLIKEDIINKVKRSETLKNFNISVHIYKDIQRGKTWKTI